MNERGLAGRLAAAFVSSKLTPLMIVAAILIGGVATWRLPREEEPQIKVPMIDVHVAMPGASAAEVEQRVARPLEQLLWEIPGVEYVYSTSSDDGALVVVRFKVGHDMETALTRLNTKIDAHRDRIPPGVSDPLIKPRGIDDVPVVTLTFHGPDLDHYRLRRIASEVEARIKALPDVAETQLIGGYRREIQVAIDHQALAARGLTLPSLTRSLQAANSRLPAGERVEDNRAIRLQAGSLFVDAEDVADTVVGVVDGRPVYLREVARVSDAPEQPDHYVFHASGETGIEAAVTLTVAKRPGSNAVAVSHAVQDELAAMRGVIIPESVTVTVTRDYGETASEKSNELLFHMAIAVVSVSLLILFMLGWREAVIVAIAIPATLGLTMAVFDLLGYTLNRITLFALIFSIGILVDDAIVVVENIVRHRRMPGNGRRPMAAIAVEATAEVGNPTILATWAVIAAILPMAGVGGLMGPYMRPIPVGASAAMLWSLLVAFVVTPWAARLLLRRHVGHGDGEENEREGPTTRVYRRLMHGLIATPWKRWSFIGGIVALLVGSFALVLFGFVRVKMLPFDNKSEFQVLVEMPAGTSLEDTAAVARRLADVAADRPPVRDYQIYAGTAAPFNFNGLVRHYYLRQGAHQADIQINLHGKHDRHLQSHDIAKTVRQDLLPVARELGARITVAEVPPGPPVLQTLVAEVYAPTYEDRLALAREVRAIMEDTDGVVDVDWYVREQTEVEQVVLDRDKAALSGIAVSEVAATLAMALDGRDVGLLHDPREKEDVAIRLRLDEVARHNRQALLDLSVGAPGRLVPLREVVSLRRGEEARDLYHKNLLPTIYVVADVAGTIESPVYAIAAMNRRLADLDATRYGGAQADLSVWNARQPDNDQQPAVKWDGEWQITLEVFRDLGIAFAAVLVLIYLLMVGWFKSFLVPVVVMTAIPFSLIGILPAHGAMGAFFSATSMIGFMAGAGIVVRNSIILVDFIQLRLRQGMPLEEAVIDAGAVRFRPMLLTALAVVVGAGVILFDPIFQGLAISLMAGEIASLLISRTAVPVFYFMLRRHDATPQRHADA